MTVKVLVVVALACHFCVYLCGNDCLFVILRLKCSEDGRKYSVSIVLDIGTSINVTFRR